MNKACSEGGYRPKCGLDETAEAVLKQGDRKELKCWNHTALYALSVLHKETKVHTSARAKTSPFPSA